MQETPPTRARKRQSYSVQAQDCIAAPATRASRQVLRPVHSVPNESRPFDLFQTDWSKRVSPKRQNRMMRVWFKNSKDSVYSFFSLKGTDCVNPENHRRL